MSADALIVQDMIKSHVRDIALAVGAVALLVGCASSNAPEVTPAPSPSASASVSEAPSPSPSPEPTADPGSRDAPLALGETRLVAANSAFTVGVTASNLDAAAVIAAADSYAPRPAEGETFVLATVTASVSQAALAEQGLDLASEGARPGISLTVEYVSATGVSYTPFSGANYCYTTNDFVSTNAVYNDGQAVTGDVCVVVPTADVPGGLWRISNSENSAVWIVSA